VNSVEVGGYDSAIFEELAALEDQSFWFRARNRLIVALAREVSRPGDSFLEIGCGTGYVLQALARQCGLSVTGSELFAEGLAFARERVPEAEFSVLDAREMPYEESFDLAGAFDVLEHIDDDVGVLRGLHRALRPGGHLLVTVPQHRWLWSDADDYAHHVRRYRRSELLDRVRGAGFEVLRVTSFVTSLLPLMLASRLLSRKGGAYDLKAELVPPAPVNRALEWMLNRECDLIARGVSLPAGGSLAVVARRRPVPSAPS
jgi:SAM-dependent methyltransferase